MLSASETNVPTPRVPNRRVYKPLTSINGKYPISSGVQAIYPYKGHMLGSENIELLIFLIIASRDAPCKSMQVKESPGNSKVQDKFAAGAEMGRIAPYIAVAVTTLSTAYLGPS